MTDEADEAATDETSPDGIGPDESDEPDEAAAVDDATPEDPSPKDPMQKEPGEAAAADDAAAVDAVAHDKASARGRRWGFDGPVGRVLAVVGALSIALAVVLGAVWLVRTAFDGGDRRDGEHHGDTMRHAKDTEHKKASGDAKGGMRVLWGDKPSDHAVRTVVIIHRGSFTHPGMKQFGANGGLKSQVGGWPKAWSPGAGRDWLGHGGDKDGGGTGWTKRRGQGGLSKGWSRGNPFSGGFMVPNFMPFDGTQPFGRDWLPPAAPGAPRAGQDPWGKGDWGSLEDLWNSERWKSEAPWGNLEDLEDLLGNDAPWLGLPDADGALQLELAEFCAQLQSGELFEDLEGLDDADESSRGLMLLGSMLLDGIFEDLCTQPTPDTENQDPDPDTPENEPR